MIIEEGLCFDDVLLVPKYSEIESRSLVSLEVKIQGGRPYYKDFVFSSPFIPANMATITGKEMIVAMYQLGALSLMHRFLPVQDQLDLFQELEKEFGQDIFYYVGASVGTKSEDRHNIKEFVKIGIRIICIDIAHLDSIQGLEMIKYISKEYPQILLIAGNVATAEAAQRAWISGADIVKVGIGASGICSTRLETGAGVPQLTAIMDVHAKRENLEKVLNRNLYFISDGGHKITADCVKSLCFADFVMLGGMLAGTNETPAQYVEIDNVMYKQYNGSSTHKNSRIEGVKSLVHTKGPVKNIITKLSEGLQSACSYQNCYNIHQLKENPTFIKITNSGIKESGIHDVAHVTDK